MVCPLIFGRSEVLNSGTRLSQIGLIVQNFLDWFVKSGFCIIGLAKNPLGGKSSVPSEKKKKILHDEITWTIQVTKELWPTNLKKEFRFIFHRKVPKCQSYIMYT